MKKKNIKISFEALKKQGLIGPSFFTFIFNFKKENSLSVFFFLMEMRNNGFQVSC